MQFFMAFQMAGAKPNLNDLGPQYASILMGIANTVGNMTGFLAPNVAGYFLTSFGVVKGIKDSCEYSKLLFIMN